MALLGGWHLRTSQCILHNGPVDWVPSSLGPIYCRDNFALQLWLQLIKSENSECTQLPSTFMLIIGMVLAVAGALATIFRNFPVFNFSSFFDHDLSGARRRNPHSAQEDAHVCPCAHSRRSVPFSNTCPGTAAVSGVSNLLRGASSI